MFIPNFFKKTSNKATAANRRPLKLPEVPKDQMNVSGIAALLNNGKPIWAWYSMTDKPDVYVTRFLTGNLLDGFAVWRIDGDYLCMYIAHFDENMTVHLKLEEIRKANNSSIMAVMDSDMVYAYSIMYDDAEYTENTLAFVNDVTPEMIEKELQDKSMWLVGNEHFYRKADYPDGLPEDIKAGNAEEKSCD